MSSTIDTPSPKSAMPGLYARIVGTLTGWLIVHMMKLANKRGDYHEFNHLRAALLIGNSGPRTGCYATSHELIKQIVNPKRDKTRAEGF
jgi:hypothetical protein